MPISDPTGLDFHGNVKERWSLRQFNIEAWMEERDHAFGQLKRTFEI